MVIMLKIDKLTVIGITAIIILTFFAGITGFFEFTLPYNRIRIGILYLSFHSNSTILMLGICLGILSTFVKRKILFYSSIITIILGQIIVAAIMGYMHTMHVYPYPPYPAESLYHPGPFGDVFISILHGNLLGSFVAILSGPTIITPYILLSVAVSKLSVMAGVISFYGFEGVILWIGSFHIYPEFYAIYLACIAGIRISLKSFKAYISIRRNGIKSTLKTIKEVMIHELRSTAPKVVILLIIAALLESLWHPFWISYWLQHIA
jgi:hypothetical protein